MVPITDPNKFADRFPVSRMGKAFTSGDVLPQIVRIQREQRHTVVVVKLEVDNTGARYCIANDCLKARPTDCNRQQFGRISEISNASK